MEAEIEGFTRGTFGHDGVTRTVYRAGHGPAVIVIAEIPGITPSVIAFARRVVDLGCTAVMPLLFGAPGREPSPGYALATVAKVCVSKEFTLFAQGRGSPVVTWLRALASHEHAACGGPGVGVVGMCLTGGFALGMMIDPSVVAPVLSQPSLPVALGRRGRDELGISDSELAQVKRRVEADDICVVGLRFTGDKLVPPERFRRLEAELGDNFVAVELDSSPGNEWGFRKAAHSVLTEDLVDEPGHASRRALEVVLDLFRTRLLGREATAAPTSDG